MIITELFNQPLLLVAWLVAIVSVLSIHEFSHALAANLLGDPTAKDNGRLTLNPLSHISWIGFLMLLLVGFGWGNPVPFNPYNLKYQRWGSAFVAVAGPLSNLLMALLGVFALKMIIVTGLVAPENLLVHFVNLFIVMNVVLMLFNLLPLPPLDGSKVLFAFFDDPRWIPAKDFLEDNGYYILIFILIFDSFFNLGLLNHLFSWGIDLLYRLLG
jgi:Zn-dependent protease